MFLGLEKSQTFLSADISTSTAINQSIHKLINQPSTP